MTKENFSMFFSIFIDDLMLGALIVYINNRINRLSKDLEDLSRWINKNCK